MRRVPFPELFALSAVALAVCAGCDRGARTDLPQGSQNLDESSADIILMPDQFPNFAHKCHPDFPVGTWTVTADWVWIVYNDPMCGGEGPITILDNVPGGEGPTGGQE